jgi:hypothetical protein
MKARMAGDCQDGDRQCIVVRDDARVTHGNGVRADWNLFSPLEKARALLRAERAGSTLPRIKASHSQPHASRAALATLSDATISDDDRLQAETLLQADYGLAQRCVAGEVAAWEELYSSYHERLVNSARGMLAGKSSDPTLAEELATRVWYLLVAKDGELLTRYNPARGARLITFLRAIERDVMGRHFRTERRRAARESTASNERPRHHSAELDQVDASLDEFLSSLSEKERQFCGDYLLNDGEDAESDLSRANVWQKTHRVYRRFLQFFQD